jgi:hypothetical protein
MILYIYILLLTLKVKYSWIDKQVLFQNIASFFVSWYNKELSSWNLAKMRHQVDIYLISIWSLYWFDHILMSWSWKIYVKKTPNRLLSYIYSKSFVWLVCIDLLWWHLSLILINWLAFHSVFQFFSMKTTLYVTTKQTITSRTNRKCISAWYNKSYWHLVKLRYQSHIFLMSYWCLYFWPLFDVSNLNY